MARHFQWQDFELDESTDAIPDKWILTIVEIDTDYPDYGGEEIAVIVHRASSAFPIDGALANQKRDNARMIVNALNKSVQD